LVHPKTRHPAHAKRAGFNPAVSQGAQDVLTQPSFRIGTKLHHRTRRCAASSRRFKLRHRQLANHTHSDLECLVVVSLCIRPAEADQVTFRTALISTVTSN